MKNEPVFVRKIEQLDRYHFKIVWTDGNNSKYRLSDLQKQCPCAKCQEMRSKQLTEFNKLVQEDIMAKRIVSVGRYALRIDFCSGCSKGIYNFEWLRQL